MEKARLLWFGYSGKDNRSSQLIGGTSATPVHCANAKLEFAQVVLGEFDESVSIRSECSTQLLGSLPR